MQSGTGANLTSMAVLCQPYQAVICGDKSHIHTSEAGATERASGGKILTVPAVGNKLIILPADGMQEIRLSWMRP